MITPPQAIANNNNIEDKKPFIFKVVSGLILYLAVRNFLAGVVISLMFYLISNAVAGAGGIEFQLLKTFPLIGLICLVPFFVAVGFAYTGLKVLDGSRRSWWLALISIVGLSVLVDFVVYTVLADFYGSFSFTSLVTMGEDQMQTVLPSIRSVPQFFFHYAIQLVALVLLIVFVKRFKYNKQPLSKISRIVVVSVVLISLVPIVYLVYGYFKSLDTNYGYEEAQSQVEYHVYRPQVIPGGREHATVYRSGQKLGNFNNAVEVAFSLPMNQTQAYSQTPIIVMKQVGVDSRYDAQNFAKTLFETASSTEVVPLQIAKSQKAYLSKPVVDTQMTQMLALTFVTEDNVLVNIITPKGDRQELIQMAESLK